MTHRTSGHFYRKNRAIVLKESTVCHLCGFDGSDSVDHVIPVSKGGTDDIENLRPAHLDCNRKKYNKDHADIRKVGGVSW